jgi:hypothetical protein
MWLISNNNDKISCADGIMYLLFATVIMQYDVSAQKSYAANQTKMWYSKNSQILNRNKQLRI